MQEKFKSGTVSDTFLLNSTGTQEKEQLIEEWQPKPLVPRPDAGHPSLNNRRVSGQIGKFVTLDQRRVLNLAGHNYLGLADEPAFKEVATRTLRKYGCGSCGPRGFYGTVGKFFAQIAHRSTGLRTTCPA